MRGKTSCRLRIGVGLVWMSLGLLEIQRRLAESVDRLKSARLRFSIG
ncbi:hypothetical protein H6F73_03600 [Microcoleus sp. FACHB-68]|nr:hypothetical protein [Microcoleus sp. FACHB-68]